MGVFYQTNTPQQIDFAYHNPTDLMRAVIANSDSRNDTAVNQLSLLSDETAKIQFLDQDRERVQSLTNAYKQKVDEIATDLTKNPQDWRKRMGTIRALGRQASTDFSTGEVAAIQNNYSKFNSWYKDETERFKKGEITADWLSAAKNKYMKDFQGTNYDPTIGVGDQIAPAPLAKHIDLNKKFEEYFAGVKANAREDKRAGMQGMYIINTEKGEESVSAERLREIAAEKLAADDETLAFVKQGTQLGIFKDPISILNAAAKGAIGANAYSKIKTAMDIKANPVLEQEDQQAHASAMQEDQQKHGLDILEKKHAYDLEDTEAANKQAERQAKLQHNLSINPDAVKVEDVTPASGAKPSPASGTSTSALKIFDADELKPDYLRTKVLPLVSGSIASLNSRIIAADASGKVELANELRTQKQTLISQQSTAQGLINQSLDDYYKSKEYTSLAPEMQQRVKGYHDYLNKNSLADTKEVRDAYVNQNIKSFTNPGGIAGKRAINPGGVEGYNYSTMPERASFDRAVNKAANIIDKNAADNADANKYNATGIVVNLADPTITGVINQAFNLGNVATFSPNTMGGARAEGGQRGVSDMTIHTGNWVRDHSQFGIKELMASTGANNPTELFDQVTVMPSTNGNMRFKVRLKETAPDGKTIGNSRDNFHRIEGMNDNREMIMEVQGTNQNAQILKTLANDTSPEIRKLALTMNSPDNVNFLNKFNSVVADTKSSDPDAFGVPVTAGYGSGVYTISKSGSGKVKAEVKIGDKVATQVFSDMHKAEEELLMLKMSLDEDPVGAVKAMEAAGTLK